MPQDRGEKGRGRTEAGAPPHGDSNVIGTGAQGERITGHRRPVGGPDLVRLERRPVEPHALGAIGREQQLGRAAFAAIDPGAEIIQFFRPGQLAATDPVDARCPVEARRFGFPGQPFGVPAGGVPDAGFQGCRRAAVRAGLSACPDFGAPDRTRASGQRRAGIGDVEISGRSDPTAVPQQVRAGGQVVLVARNEDPVSGLSFRLRPAPDDPRESGVLRFEQERVGHAVRSHVRDHGRRGGGRPSAQARWRKEPASQPRYHRFAPCQAHHPLPHPRGRCNRAVRPAGGDCHQGQPASPADHWRRSRADTGLVRAAPRVNK